VIDAETVERKLRRALDFSEQAGVEDAAVLKEMAMTALEVAYPNGHRRRVEVSQTKVGPAAEIRRNPAIRAFYSAGWPGEQEKIRLALAATLDDLQDGMIKQLPVVPSQLHPWFAAEAAELWAAGNHRHAVEEAARAVEIRLRDKIGWDGNGTGSKLVEAAFGAAAPKSGERRLRFAGYQTDSDAWRDAHLGAMAFGRGCFMRLRNLHTHGQVDAEPEEFLEALAAFSLLARWVDSANVVEGA
jgi:hypothetical protein